MAGKVRRLTCCCCGEDAGSFEQHPNRDDGFGICASCIARFRRDGMSEAEILDLYGREGVNFASAALAPCPDSLSGEHAWLDGNGDVNVCNLCGARRAPRRGSKEESA